MSPSYATLSQYDCESNTVLLPVQQQRKGWSPMFLLGVAALVLIAVLALTPSDERTTFHAAVTDDVEDTVDDCKNCVRNGLQKTKTFVRDAVRGSKNLVGDGLNGSTTLVGDALKGATDLAGNALNTATDLVGRAVTGITNLAGNIMNGAVDLVGDGCNAVGDVLVALKKAIV